MSRHNNNAQVRGHPQFVKMLGVCNATSSVSDYFGDSVEALLKRTSGHGLPVSKVLPMALDAARGLQVLHEMPGGPIVHLDIWPPNLLLDVQGRLKINDFNACHFIATDGAGHSCAFDRGHKPPFQGWHAPEHIAGEVIPFTSRSHSASSTLE